MIPIPRQPGIALDRLLMLGMITGNQHTAGTLLAANWPQRRMATHQAVVTLPRAKALVWSIIETVVADDMVPPRLDPAHPLGCGGWSIGRRALADGLNVIEGTCA